MESANRRMEMNIIKTMVLVSEFRSLLWLHTNLRSPDIFWYRADSWSIFLAIFGVFVRQSLSESVHLCHAVSGRELVESDGVPRDRRQPVGETTHSTSAHITTKNL